MRPPRTTSPAGAVVAAGVLVTLLWVASPAVAQAGVEVRSGLRYATHGGVDLLLDVYLPPGDGPFPAVIVIPGGRWVEIDRAKHADVPAYFAERGVAAFAIEYRSAVESPYPAAVQDVASAIRWVRAHADDFGVDASALGTVGVSSGGHLAALAAARGSGPLDEGSRVSVVASWSGMMDLRPLVDAADVELREAVRTFLGCPASDPCTRGARAASPIVHVDPSDPPMVLVNGSEEIVPVDQAESMGAALGDAGVEGHVVIAQGGHGAGYGGGNKILDQVFPFVQAWLTGREAPSPSEEPDASGQDEGGGKGAIAPAPSAAPASPTSPTKAGDGATQQGAGAGAPAVRGASSSFGVAAVAVAMIAVLVVFVQLVVIARLRRRAVAPVRPPEDDVPSGAGMEGT